METSKRAMPVVELSDVTQEAALLGFRCRITVYPPVLERCELGSVLAGLRNALVGATGGAGKARMFDVAFGIPSMPARSDAERHPPGATLRFRVAGRSGAEKIMCRLWYLVPTLVLRLSDELEQDVGSGQVVFSPLLDERAQTAAWVERAMWEAAGPRLFVLHDGQRYPVRTQLFMIGHDRTSADLAIPDRLIARKHAAVTHRNGEYHIHDLGSRHGVVFRGLRIGNKRIEEGDAFVLGVHEVRFTFLEDD